MRDKRNGAQNTSPSSMRENLERKLKKIASYGDKMPQPRAEFRGNRRGKVPYYEAKEGHLPYDAVSAYWTYGTKDVDPSWAKPTKRVIPQVPPSRTGGVVGPEMDWSVRARNMPIIFIKQMKQYGIPTNPIYQKIFNILFTNREFVHPRNRPKVGCSPTFHWTDFQVETWTKLANYLGVQYHGKHDYTFPKGCLGKAIGGSYYYERKPWPKPGTKEDHCPFFRLSTGGKRSEFSRIKRSLRKIKDVAVKPIDFSRLLCVRREKTAREIRASWNRSEKTFSEHRESIPLILSLDTKKPHPVPEIVLDAIKRMAKSVCKVYPEKPWIVERPLEPYRVRLELPPRREVIHRLMPYISADGNVYLTRSGMDGRQNLMLSKNFSQERLDRALDIVSKANEVIDECYPLDPERDRLGGRSNVLGSWYSDEDQD